MTLDDLAERAQRSHDACTDILDAKAEEDLTCADLIVLSMLCLLLAFVYIITGAV